ncbi:zinc finger protein 583-like [Corythoichthys intestinalis]|uniref:zinc finger protein 583-like n=1 Tax=Corythoichthys intestinalis TaxID=161448 RepID=UPI0025A4DA38|nr:zinc finger protein 583-like [Corythoichthys intestinalis]
MLKELVRERLIAAADEIFGLFERTITSYEEQLCRAREESERHRRQLQAICKTQVVIRVEDVQQLIGRQEELSHQLQCRVPSLEQEHTQPPNIKKEEDLGPPQIKEETDDPEPPMLERMICSYENMEDKEADANKLSLPGVSVKSDYNEDGSTDWPQLSHLSPNGDHCGGPPLDNLSAPMSDSDDVEEPLGSDGVLQSDDKQSECSQKDINLESKSQRRKKNLTCSHCGKRYPNKSKLIKHLKNHTGERPFSCEVCSKAFSRKQHLALHVKTHMGEKPFICEVCSQTFSQKQHLELHMKKHTGEKPFSLLLTQLAAKYSLESNTWNST